jgi:hypothetical protein
MGPVTEKTGEKRAVPDGHLELQAAPVGTTVRSRHHLIDPFGRNPGPSPERFGQNGSFLFQLGRVTDVLPGAPPALAEDRTYRFGTKRRGCYDLGNRSHTVRFFPGRYPESNFITGTTERDKADFSVNPADTIAAEGKFVDIGNRQRHVTLARHEYGVIFSPVSGIHF